MEIWKNIEGYEGYYQVSNKGNVRSLVTNKLLSQTYCKDGYLKVHFNVNSVDKTRQVHRLVAKHFCPNSENKPQVNHIDGNKTNNNASNLEWVTQKENMKHAFKNNLIKPITRTVKAINVKTGEITIFESILKAATVLGINKTNITAVCRGRQKTAGGFIWQYAD